MNDRGRMMLRAQCVRSDYDTLMHNRRVIWVRGWKSGSLQKQMEEELEIGYQEWKQDPNPLETAEQGIRKWVEDHAEEMRALGLPTQVVFTDEL